jgi:hypothetical protein
MLIQRAPGVKHVLDVRLSQRPVVPLTEKPVRVEGEEPAEAALTPVEGRRLDLPPYALLCSLSHTIKIAEL